MSKPKRKNGAKQKPLKPNEQKPKPRRWSYLRKPTIGAAIIGALTFVVVEFIKRARSSAPIQTVSSEIKVDPEIEIENKPENIFKPSVKVGLDEKDVGKEISKAVDPLAQTMSAVDKKLEALGDQLAQAQLAPKHPVPDSDDPLKVKAVEFYNAGVDTQNLGKIGQAIGHYFDALELDPDLAAAHNNLGVALKAKGDVDGAIEHYNEALRIDPDDAPAHNNLGNALADKGNLDGAIEQYKEALRIDADHANAHYNLGLALNDNGDLDGAIGHFRKAIRINPDYALAKKNLAIALAKKKDSSAGGSSP